MSTKSERDMAIAIANFRIDHQYTNQEIRLFCFDRMVDELEKAPNLATRYTEMLKAKQDLTDQHEPKGMG